MNKSTSGFSVRRLVMRLGITALAIAGWFALKSNEPDANETSPEPSGEIPEKTDQEAMITPATVPDLTNKKDSPTRLL